MRAFAGSIGTDMPTDTTATGRSTRPSSAERPIQSGVDRPVFFVGAPRSGTTILFEAFSAHEDLAWFSNYLYRFPNFPIVSVISRLAFSNRLMGSKPQNGESRLRKPLPKASECYPAWDLICGKRFRFDYLLNVKATAAERQKGDGLVAAVTKYQGKTRFATKITGPTRMSYLDSIFPDALFVHVVRDGRAVVNSLMNVGFWKKGGGYEKPWWGGGLLEEDLEIYRRYDRSPLVLTAIQWRRIMLVAREEAALIGSDRYIEIRYEDALQNPYLAIDGLLDFSCLKRSKKVHEYIRTNSSLKNMNVKFPKDLSSRDITVLNEVLGDVNSQFGYP
jgi:hypothetical protein